MSEAKPRGPGLSWKKLLIPLSVVPFLALLAYAFKLDPKYVPSPLIQKPAPDFTLKLLDGGTIILSHLRGRPVVVNFWASWCFPACWNEAPRLEAAWQRYKDRGLMIIGVVYQDREQNARDFIAQHGKTYPNGMDPESRIAIDYGVYGVPETFFIDRGGLIAHKQIGEISTEILTAQVEKLLGPAPVAAVALVQ